MGAGSKFDSDIGTRGGRQLFFTETDIKNDNTLANDIINEMTDEETKFNKEKIIFLAKLENGRKIFFEQKALEHIIIRHADDFNRKYNIRPNQIKSLLCNAISKGELIESKRKDSHGKEGYRNTYKYKEQYYIVYSIASNGYIETAFPK